MTKLFHKLKLSGLLSFGPDGVDLPMERLNVLIGPNGSGKSNLLEAISLLQAVPSSLSQPFLNTGGIREWMWKGANRSSSFTVETLVDLPPGEMVRHVLTLAEWGVYPIVEEEDVAFETRSGGKEDPVHEQPSQDGRLAARSPQLRADSDEFKARELEEEVEFEPQRESRLRNPNPFIAGPPLKYLGEQYMRIRLYRNWSFGPGAELRRPCVAHARSDFLDEGGENLPLVLSNLHGASKRKLLEGLRKLFDGIVDFHCPVTSGLVSLFLEESGGRSIPATRLSDGTLRYLCLLAVLLHSEPPSLIGIEEPELGLHPDLLPGLADLLVEASERTQLIVTTHSDVLVDALTDRPESVVVCEKHDGQTEMRRLDKADLAKWLKDYRLGDLWTSGELGGNRW